MTNASLPAPPVPADCDLRGMTWMPYFGDQIATSDFDCIASDEAWRVAHRLWWTAWRQVPAASLPKDDAILASLAGLRRDPKGWKRVRDAALHGFIECSDGRLYHRFLASEAVKASRHKEAAAGKRKADRERLQRWRAGPGEETPDETGSETPDETRFVAATSRQYHTRPDQTVPDQTGLASISSSPPESKTAKHCNRTTRGSASAPPDLDAAVAAISDLIGRKLDPNDRMTVAHWLGDKQHPLRQITKAIESQIELRGIGYVIDKPLRFLNGEIAAYRFSRRYAA